MGEEMMYNQKWLQEKLKHMKKKEEIMEEGWAIKICSSGKWGCKLFIENNKVQTGAQSQICHSQIVYRKG